MEYCIEYVEKFKEFYASVDQISDPRTEQWPLIKSPVITYVSSFIYIIFAAKLGPYLMRNQEPFNLRYLLLFYNAALFYLNYHIFKELLLGMINSGYSWPCQPYTLSYDPEEIRIASALWWYYISKLIEFADTMFFVLRKKNNQISFLHVYHHSTMPLLWWIGIKWTPCGQAAHAAIVNAFIHIIMYFYYGVAGLGPQFQKYLWWKKYLTQMQLVQFMFCLCVAIYSLWSDCDFPRWMSQGLIIYMISFLVLFGNFYLQSYIKQQQSKKLRKTEMNGHRYTTDKRKLEKTE